MSPPSVQGVSDYPILKGTFRLLQENGAVKFKVTGILLRNVEKLSCEGSSVYPVFSKTEFTLIDKDGYQRGITGTRPQNNFAFPQLRFRDVSGPVILVAVVEEVANRIPYFPAVDLNNPYNVLNTVARREMCKQIQIMAWSKNVNPNLKDCFVMYESLSTTSFAVKEESWGFYTHPKIWYSGYNQPLKDDMKVFVTLFGKVRFPDRNPEQDWGTLYAEPRGSKDEVQNYIWKDVGGHRYSFSGWRCSKRPSSKVTTFVELPDATFIWQPDLSIRTPGLEAISDLEKVHNKLFFEHSDYWISYSHWHDIAKAKSANNQPK